MENLQFSVLSNEARIVPTMIEKKVSNKDYIFYGEDNQFPQYIWDLYLKSSILQGIVNGTSDFVLGNGVSTAIDIVNDEGETLEDVIKKLVIDFNIFGGFCFQGIRDHLGNIKEIYWLDMQNVRVGKDDDKIYYSEKWGCYGEKAIAYDLFDPTKQQPTFVVYFKGHISRGVYPIPRYVGALAAIETSTEIGKFHLNNILNNLSSSAIINFNSGEPSEEDKKRIEKRLEEKFSGSSNAGKFILAFNDNKDNAVTIERLAEDNFDEKFQTLSKSTKEEIFIAHRAYPSLFGMMQENNGFSRVEFDEAFQLYNKTVVQPIQKDIQRVFDRVFGVDKSIIFKKFSLDEEIENKLELV